MISILMPAYNADKTISASINSVLAQTLADFELIIIDDCSTDATYSLCKSFAANDNRIRVLRNAVNMGVAETRNRGVAEAKGEWAAFLDSDDVWHPDKLQKQMAFIAETGAAISYTASEFIDAIGNKFGYTLHAERELTYSKLLRRNLMSCSSVIVRRDVMQSVKFQSGSLHEDYAAWMTILREVGVAYGLDEPLLAYRVSKGSKSRGRLRSGMMVFRAYRSVGYGAAMSAIMTVRYSAHSLKKWKNIKLSPDFLSQRTRKGI